MSLVDRTLFRPRKVLRQPDVVSISLRNDPALLSLLRAARTSMVVIFRHSTGALGS